MKFCASFYVNFAVKNIELSTYIDVETFPKTSIAY